MNGINIQFVKIINWQNGNEVVVIFREKKSCKLSANVKNLEFRI